MRLILSMLGLVVLLATPALAIEVQPGFWQDTETIEVDGQTHPPTVTTDCLTPADAKDIVKTAQANMKESMKDQAQQCSKLDIKENGNVILFEMKCGDPKQGTVEASMVMTVHSLQSTSSVIKSTIGTGGQPIVSTMKTESKWISASCDKK